MKLIIFFLIYFSIATNLYSQNIDSLRYENGYLYFHKYGSGDPVIILTGGPGASYHQLEEVAKQVGSKNRAILLEQRGTGRSIPKPFNSSTINLKEAQADLNRLLDHLKLKEADFLGHSWGAMLAMSFASEFPDRVKSLILLNPGPFKLDSNTNQIYTHNKDTRLTAVEKQRRSQAFQKNKNQERTDADKALVEKWELLPVLYDRDEADSLAPLINKGG